MGGQFLEMLNKICFISCVIAVSLDTLFLYIPVFHNGKMCLGVDKTLAICACVLRSVTDAVFLLYIVFQFRTKLSSRAFGSSVVFPRAFGWSGITEGRMTIAKRSLPHFFIIDILSVLPLPQAVLIIFPKLKGSVSLVLKDALKYIILSQYVPRIIRIYPLYKDLRNNSEILKKPAWAGAVLYLVLYTQSSQVVGAIWYMLSIDRKEVCWRSACASHQNCNYKDLYCGEYLRSDNTFLYASCSPIAPDGNQNSFFNFGIFSDALESGVIETRDFMGKFFYCFWWGLRNLSSLGQNLQTSIYFGEILFSVSVSVCGLFLFSVLIGNVQKYLMSLSLSVDREIEEMRAKRVVEQWMSNYMLPEDLREQIRWHKQKRWQENSGVDQETLNPDRPMDLLTDKHLPKDLMRGIKRHLCIDLLKRVPICEKMDEQQLNEMCEHLKPVFHIERSIIAREGDPVDEMLFIMRGCLLTTTNCGRSDFYLGDGDFCGEELLIWALSPNSLNLPTSMQLIRARTNVECFALMADDMKFVASQWRRHQSWQQLKHTFRFYSRQWRTWAACFIQAAWRRFRRWKLQKVLGVTLYASKFAVSALRTLPHDGARLRQRSLPPQPQKPAEPDFSVPHNGARLRQRSLPLQPQKPAEPDFSVEYHY